MQCALKSYTIYNEISCIYGITKTTALETPKPLSV